MRGMKLVQGVMCAARYNHLMLYDGNSCADASGWLCDAPKSADLGHDGRTRRCKEAVQASARACGGSGACACDRHAQSSRLIWSLFLEIQLRVARQAVARHSSKRDVTRQITVHALAGVTQGKADDVWL